MRAYTKAARCDYMSYANQSCTSEKWGERFMIGLCIFLFGQFKCYFKKVTKSHGAKNSFCVEFIAPFLCFSHIEQIMALTL